MGRKSHTLDPSWLKHDVFNYHAMTGRWPTIRHLAGRLQVTQRVVLEAAAGRDELQVQGLFPTLRGDWTVELLYA